MAHLALLSGGQLLPQTVWRQPSRSSCLSRVRLHRCVDVNTSDVDILQQERYSLERRDVTRRAGLGLQNTTGLERLKQKTSCYATAHPLAGIVLQVWRCADAQLQDVCPWRDGCGKQLALQRRYLCLRWRTCTSVSSLWSAVLWLWCHAHCILEISIGFANSYLIFGHGIRHPECKVPVYRRSTCIA